MESVLQFSPDQYFNFILVVLRIGGLFVTAPILSSANVPRRLRLFMVLMVSWMLFAVLPNTPIAQNWNASYYLLMATRETMIGLLLGVVPRATFAAVDFAGTVIGFQMGLSLANVMDPQSQTQVSMISSFKGLLATLLFVIIDGHHTFFEVIALSYDKVAIGTFAFNPNILEFLLRLGGDMIILGVKLGSPFIVALLFANLILGFMARAMPQMNIFVVGMPLTILLGFLFLMTGMPYTTGAMHKAFSGLEVQVIEMLNLMAK
ncbi:MAG: flagellar biosynthetic protein FliR [Candidatus Lambdaproteobacteria bacterium RIFOXYD1_FULL_56_27]|uniref:Flagellar biosynthetic protein FliR n=1 Tax=Candidatus Lambdaproteobacteria bacterium RIFOXYD2_FULL_56_26 TaxID=1817773 RepID=A0A1F6H2X1_9PROT|nr:MAG: flagellar biosynthetic protein FliR [Candidatus Lambdaproteobacteria bacterium RIFOXYC1_FULL_56_13]OGH04630.1 MAG: flagellar biosynthetic protein FliR [Candidatus Lambdaproteobacteria bacterium RIFOXYD2_FULL_56_26]OGH09094.1 MAG: flagellar biosynthetic protein FliR [Candidatus Lambdaproteobacteria bacterium RIFOXYD1_FULL_56_27]